jgi:hypothetical protein
VANSIRRPENASDTPSPRVSVVSDRLDGKPMQTKHMKVDAQGQIHESTFEEARKALSIPLQV